jgi:hypothetical protein
MASPFAIRSPSPTWRFALVSLLVSLPAMGVVNWLPNSQTGVSGTITSLERSSQEVSP